MAPPNTASQVIAETAHRINPAIAIESAREDPDVVETVGVALADLIRPHEVDSIVLWHDSHTSVLGHVIARTLRAKLIYAYADQGILSLSDAPPLDSRAAVVDFEWDLHPGLSPLLTLLRRTLVVPVVASVMTAPTAESVGDATTLSLTAAVAYRDRSGK